MSVPLFVTSPMIDPVVPPVPTCSDPPAPICSDPPLIVVSPE